MSQYGVFANIAGTALALAAATTAISLAWTKRSKWQPPEEVVSDATARLASLGAMVSLALIYTFGQSVLGARGTALVAIVGFTIAICALGVTIYLSVARSFKYPDGSRTLGGFRLTSEATKIQKRKGQSEQQMFTDAQGDHDLVWTPQSRAVAHVAMTFAFIALILCGTIALSAAAAFAFAASQA